MKSVRNMAAIGLCLMLAGTIALTRARAADLTMGIAVEPDSIDPHFHWFGGDLNVSFQIFEPLVRLGANGTLSPGLATSWKPLDDTSWEFTLRPGVTFQDGTALSASDVAFTYQRAPTVPRSPSGFGPFLRRVASVDVPDNGHVVVHTAGPDPLLPTDLAMIGIVSRHVGGGASTQDYNSSHAAIGTGPYRFGSWLHGDRITLERNDAYWDAAPPWDTVTLRFIPDAAARLAAFRAGDVALIDAVPLDDAPALKRDAAFRVREAVSNNVIAFQLDVSARKPPFVTGPNGEALSVNPLADVRVRRALAMAINRPLLRDRLMNGEMAVADQMMAPGQFGYDPKLQPIPYDPAQGRQLLAESGYPGGFRLTMQCQADRYPNGAQLCEAAAQMFTRIGVRATPDPMPHLTFIGHANRHEYSLFTMFMLNDTEEPSQAMMQMFATQNAAKGWGIMNRGQFDDGGFDQLLEAAERQVDPAAREATLRRAEDMLTTHVAWIPLLRPLNIEAMRATLDHAPRGDGYVLAADVHPAGK